MPSENVLIRIVTAFDATGLNAAQAGFLGLTPQIALAGAALAGLVIVGKSAVENYEAQQKATKDLSQAVKEFNDQYGVVIPASEKATQALAKAQDAVSKAQDANTIATNAVIKAQMAYTDAVNKHGKASEEAKKAALSLQDAQIHLKEAQDASADAGATYNAALEAAQPTTQKSIVYIDSLTKEFKDFIETNKRYIPDQYAAEAALASFIRAGEPAPMAMRLLSDSLDLATIKTEGMDEATKTLLLALNGNSKGLRDLGISTAAYNDIMKGTGTTQEKQIALLTLIETKTKDGRKATSDLTQSQNELNVDWQNFSQQIGPPVVGALDDIVRAADIAINILSELSTIIGDIIASPGKLGTALSVIGGSIPGGSTTGFVRGVRRAGGGPVFAGGTYTVGESGIETLVMGSSGGFVIPHGGSSSTTHATSVYIDLRGAFIPDGPTVDRLTNLIAERIRFAPGT